MVMNLENSNKAKKVYILYNLYKYVKNLQLLQNVQNVTNCTNIKILKGGTVISTHYPSGSLTRRLSDYAPLIRPTLICICSRAISSRFFECGHYKYGEAGTDSSSLSAASPFLKIHPLCFIMMKGACEGQAHRPAPTRRTRGPVGDGRSLSCLS